MPSEHEPPEGMNAWTVERPVVAFDTSGLAPLPDFAAEPDDIASFGRDGVVLLRGVFTDWVEPLIRGLDRNLADPKAFAFPCESTRAGEPGRFFDSYCNWQRIPEYRDFVLTSQAAALAGRFMKSQRSQFFHEHCFLKEPGTQRATPWHQDLPYYCVDGAQTASVYVSLDHAPAETAVRFAAGSHRWGRLFRPRVFLDGADLNKEDANLEPVPDIDARSGDYDIRAWDLEPGDTIIFDFRTLHGSGNAEVKQSRRAFSTRWLGDDVRYCERPGETSPPFPGIGLKPGEPLREDWFPVLWRREA